jgi:hypothetical protein
MAKRKISYNYLFLKMGEFEQPIENALSTILNYIISKEKVDRKQDVNNEKIAFLDNINYDTTSEYHTMQILFKSAKHSYRAPLLDKNTVESRENPKTMSEGEQMKTHVLVKFKDGDAIIFLETGSNMLTCGNIVNYLNQALLSYNSQFREDDEQRLLGKFSFEMIARDDFQEILQGMDRVLCAEIFIDKSVLGSEVLNFSNSAEQVKENILLTIKAERKKSIKETLYDIIDKYNSAQSKIRRIRITGKNTNGNASIIDTDFIVKKEFIEVQQDSDTGEYISANVFSQLLALSNEY